MPTSTFSPSIRVCFTDSCTKLKVYDTTGGFSGTNPGGWDAPYFDPLLGVSASSLTYTTSASTTPIVIPVDVSEIVESFPDPITGEFLIAEVTITPFDGQYTFVYTLTDSTNQITKSYSVSIFNLCSVRCCIDKLWAKAAQNLVAGDCGCSSDKPSYTKTAMLAEATYNAILNGVSCGDTVTRDALLAKLQRICKLENCNC